MMQRVPQPLPAVKLCTKTVRIKQRTKLPTAPITSSECVAHMHNPHLTGSVSSVVSSSRTDMARRSVVHAPPSAPAPGRLGSDSSACSTASCFASCAPAAGGGGVSSGCVSGLVGNSTTAEGRVIRVRLLRGMPYGQYGHAPVGLGM